MWVPYQLMPFQRYHQVRTSWYLLRNLFCGYLSILPAHSLIHLLFLSVQEFPERIPGHPGPRPAAGLQPSAVRLVT
jgi:hypothetical protein